MKAATIARYGGPETLADAKGAALFFGGLTAADFLIDKANLRPGDSLLIHGATGAAGSAAIQIGCRLGARVSAVARAENHGFARELGAMQTIGYRAGPIRGQWDAVLDVVGSLPYTHAAALLAPGGRLLPVTAPLAQQLACAVRPRRGRHRISGGIIGDSKRAMQRLLDLHAAGAYRPSVCDVLPFDQIAAAHASAGSRHKRGNSVLLLARGSRQLVRCLPRARKASAAPGGRRRQDLRGNPDPNPVRPDR